MIVPRLPRHIAIDQPARGLEIEHEGLCLQQRGMDPLPLAGFFPFQQRQHHALGSKQTGGQIGDRNADPHRPLPRRAGDRHQAAHPLGDLIETRPLGIGSVLAEPGNARHDNPRVDCRQGIVIDPQPGLHIRAVILHHHISLGHQLEENLLAGRLLQIEGQRAFVAMEVLEIRGVTGTTQ